MKDRSFLDSMKLRSALMIAGLALAVAAGACSKKKAEGGKRQAIQNIGSDTMVNLAQAWAEAYAAIDSTVSVEVSGGGSGVGIAALINGTADIANSSRALEPEERKRVTAARGQEPKEILVGFDGLAVYVHRDNPLDHISLEELSDIYREGGAISKWSQLGVASVPGAKGDDIVRVSRQNNSGTYHYFREMVVGKKSDMKAGSLDMNGSKDVVELVGRTPGAIGYSGLGYATSQVKIVKVSKKKGDVAIVPSIATVHDKTYPISRPLLMYTPHDPPAYVQNYLAWIVSDAGQAVVRSSGYVPLVK